MSCDSSEEGRSSQGHTLAQLLIAKHKADRHRCSTVGRLPNVKPMFRLVLSCKIAVKECSDICEEASQVKVSYEARTAYN
jgi:hypothetical protein